MKRTLAAQRAGFSLVEILVAILVLGLGLLGLGAVFPAVIAQQREATDQTEGEVRVTQVRRMIESGRLFNVAALAYAGDDSVLPTQADASGVFGATSWINRGLAPDAQDNAHVAYVLTGNTRGDMIMPQTAGGIGGEVVPVSARLIPSPATGEQPVYVWDLLTRRQPGTDLLQVAVFLRRVDTGIRLPRGRTLSDALIGANYDTDRGVPRVVPVGVTDAYDDPEPTKDGTGEYAAPIGFQARVFNPDGNGQVNGRDSIMFLDNGLERKYGSFAFRVGQRLLDEFGVVRRVTAVDREDGRLRARVEPAFGPGVARAEMVFTPQTPVRVEVFVIGE